MQSVGAWHIVRKQANFRRFFVAVLELIVDSAGVYLRIWHVMQVHGVRRLAVYSNLLSSPS